MSLASDAAAWRYIEWEKTLNIRDREFLLEKIKTLYNTLSHGDDKHRAWLHEAILCHFEGKPAPPAYDKNGKIKQRWCIEIWEAEVDPGGHNEIFYSNLEHKADAKDYALGEMCRKYPDGGPWTIRIFKND